MRSPSWTSLADGIDLEGNTGKGEETKFPQLGSEKEER